MEPVHSVHVALHSVHTSLITISFVFVHALAHVKSVVLTNPESHEVQVVVLEAQVRQFESQE